jgi:protein O-mannosyl-transferase
MRKSKRESSDRRAATSRPISRVAYAWLAVALVVLTVLVYQPVLQSRFLGLDDDDYLTSNPNVQHGLTAAGVKWAFTSFHASNWHPLTWMSHTLDWQLYGSGPIGHHAANLVIHVANVLLLFWVLTLLTGMAWRSAFVAALFAIHPLHVESVAWVSERKDVLSTLFWLLTMLAYVTYARRGGAARYVLVVVLYALGLMAKPMLVSLPIVLLMLDWWPLQKRGTEPFLHSGPPVSSSLPAKRALSAFLPLFAMAAGSCLVTVIAQRAGGAVATFEKFPIGSRIANSLVSYATYLWQMVWPSGLACHYPYHRPGAEVVAGAAALLAAISVLAILTRKRRPYIAFGWMWYLVTLVPVIGLVQVGSQAHADRYTYVPLVGIFVAIAWGAAELGGRRLAPVAGVVIVALAVAANIQVRYWENDCTLFGHALRVTRDNGFAHNNYGVALDDRGQPDLAIYHYERAIEIDRHDPEARFNLATMLLNRGRNEEAAAHYREGLKSLPDDARAHHCLAVVLSRLGRVEEAFEEYSTAMKLDPHNPLVLYDIGTLESELGRSDQALEHLQEAAELKPGFATAHNNIGTIFFKQRRYSEAARAFEEAIRMRSDYNEARINLAVTYYSWGHYAKAWDTVRECEAHGCSLPPGLTESLARKMPEPNR